MTENVQSEQDLGEKQPEVVNEQALNEETAQKADEPGEDSSQVDSADAEKMIPQSHVNKLIGREKQQAREQARREIEAELRARQQNNGVQQDQQQGFEGMTPDQIAQVIEQRVEQRQAQKNAYETGKRIADEFSAKVQAEMASDPEFADLYYESGIENNQNFAPIILEVNKLPNTGEVLKEILKNPSKMANVLQLMHSGTPFLAQRELARFSQSLEQNKQALKQERAPAPLSQVKPSNSGIGDGSSMSVADMRKNLFSKRRN